MGEDSPRGSSTSIDCHPNPTRTNPRLVPIKRKRLKRESDQNDRRGSMGRHAVASAEIPPSSMGFQAGCLESSTTSRAVSDARGRTMVAPSDPAPQVCDWCHRRVVGQVRRSRARRTTPPLSSPSFSLRRAPSASHASTSCHGHLLRFTTHFTIHTIGTPPFLSKPRIDPIDKRKAPVRLPFSLVSNSLDGTRARKTKRWTKMEVRASCPKLCLETSRNTWRMPKEPSRNTAET